MGCLAAKAELDGPAARQPRPSAWEWPWNRPADSCKKGRSGAAAGAGAGQRGPVCAAHLLRPVHGAGPRAGSVARPDQRARGQPRWGTGCWGCWGWLSHVLLMTPSTLDRRSCIPAIPALASAALPATPFVMPAVATPGEPSPSSSAFTITSHVVSTALAGPRVLPRRPERPAKWPGATFSSGVHLQRGGTHTRNQLAPVPLAPCRSAP